MSEKWPSAEEVENAADLLRAHDEWPNVDELLGQFATLLRQMEAAGSPVTDAFLEEIKLQTTADNFTWAIEWLAEKSRHFEQLAGAIEARTVERCIAWLEGAQVDESGRLILTRNFIVANLSALPSASAPTVPFEDWRVTERRNRQQEQCGHTGHGFFCVLPKAHNMGSVDIPQNHQADRRKGEA